MINSISTSPLMVDVCGTICSSTMVRTVEGGISIFSSTAAMVNGASNVIVVRSPSWVMPTSMTLAEASD